MRQKTFVALGVYCLCYVSLAAAEAGVVVRKTVDKTLRFEQVEEIQINGSHKVKLEPATVSQATPADLKRLAKVEIASVGMLLWRDGHIWTDGRNGPASIVLPEDFAASAPVDLAQIPGRLTIELITSRKPKQSRVIAPEELFAYFTAVSPDQAALEFAFNDGLFQSVDEQLLAVEGWAAAFSKSPFLAKIKERLHARTNADLAEYEETGALPKLLRAEKYAAAASRIFASDSAISDIHKGITEKVGWMTQTSSTLRSAAAGQAWDRFLEVYSDFEPYQNSYPDLSANRQTALEISTHLHAKRAHIFERRGDHARAIAEISVALLRDPDNPEIRKFLERERLLISLADAKVNAAKLPRLPKDSPEERQFRRSVFVAEHAIQDKDDAKAEAALQEADSENKGAPEILLLRSQLLAYRGRHSEALSLLDQYDHTVIDASERDRGDAVRNQILYELDNKRAGFQRELQKLLTAGEYSKLQISASRALALDGNDDEFLFYAGAASAVLRSNEKAAGYLRKYLDRSNSMRGDPARRRQAFQLLRIFSQDESAAVPATANWMSGVKLGNDTFYCPVSGAFQVPVESITGYKMRMNFEWQNHHLRTIASSFENEKASRSYKLLNGAGEGTDPADTGNFYFYYLPDADQVQTVSGKKLPTDPVYTDVRVGTVSGHSALVDAGNSPRLAFYNHAEVNVAAADILNNHIALGVAGNSFFNPFVWDGLHYFSLAYDREHRLSRAEEWGTDNALEFTWDNDRLLKIAAYRKDSKEPYYARVMSYDGSQLVAETYSAGPKSGRIRYVYSSGKLLEAHVEDAGVHDGKTWIARMRQ